MVDPTRAAAANSKGAAVGTGAAIAAGLAGIVASSCCVLPIVLASVGLGGVAAVLLPPLAAWRPWLLGAAVLAIVAGWLGVLRARRVGAGGPACSVARPVRRSSGWLAVASAVVLLALIWQGVVEPRLLVWVR